MFEAIVPDLRMLLREIEERPPQPRAAIFDSRTLQSSAESGERAGDDGHKRRWGSKVPLAGDTLGQLLALLVTPANASDRKQVAELAQKVQEATGDSVEVAFVDQDDTGEQPAADAEKHDIRLEVVKLPTAKRGFVLLPCRWVVECSNAWLARDDERLPEALVGLHDLAFAILLAQRFLTVVVQSAEQALACHQRHGAEQNAVESERRQGVHLVLLEIAHEQRGAEVGDEAGDEATDQRRSQARL